MLSPRLTNCVECGSIPDLLKDIDCKLTEVSFSLYNNITLMLNKPVAMSVMLDLLNYKRILTYKYWNPLYAEKYSVEQIANKVKLLKYK
jgi:hypothetical protein